MSNVLDEKVESLPGIGPVSGAALRERGITREAIEQVCYHNSLACYGQSGQIKEEDWTNPLPVDQRNLLHGNSVLRGGQEPRVDDEDSLVIE